MTRINNVEIKLIYAIILARWVNADGSRPKTVIAYDIREV